MTSLSPGIEPTGLTRMYLPFGSPSASVTSSEERQSVAASQVIMSVPRCVLASLRSLIAPSGSCAHEVTRLVEKRAAVVRSATVNIRTNVVRLLLRIRAIDMCDGHFFKPPGISSKAELADAVASSISFWRSSY